MNHYEVLDKFALLDTEEDLDLLEVDDEADDDDDAYFKGGLNIEEVMGSFGWDADPEL
jgi:hypothetical protein